MIPREQVQFFLDRFDVAPQSYNGLSINALTDAQLANEYLHWDNKCQAAKTWGAALAASNEMREECAQEIIRRERLII